MDAARKAGATLLIRGLRDATDFDYEMQMAGMNGPWRPRVQTVFLPASPGRATSPPRGPPDRGMGGDVSAFVPATVAARLKKRFALSRRNQETSSSVFSLFVVGLVCASPPSRRCTCRPGADRRTRSCSTPAGHVIIKLRPDLAPKHVERIKELTRKGFYNNGRSTA